MSITFDYDAWKAAYPVFSAIDAGEANGYFERAQNIMSNAGWTGSLPNAQSLFGLLVSHIAWLSAMRDGNGKPSSNGTIPPPDVVGRISSASEGSVSVQTEYDKGGGASPSQAWFLQTRWGSEFWQATLSLRTAVYIPRQTPLPSSAAYPWRRR